MSSQILTLTEPGKIQEGKAWTTGNVVMSHAYYGFPNSILVKTTATKNLIPVEHLKSTKKVKEQNKNHLLLHKNQILMRRKHSGHSRCSPNGPAVATHLYLESLV